MNVTPATEAAIVGRLRRAGCVFAEDEATLLIAEATDEDHLDAMVGLRSAGQPLEHIVGWVDFCGLRVVVEPGVFVPRQRTEFLVRRAMELIGDRTPPPVVVDLCCGCGALGAALAHRRAVELYAADVDPAAVRSARLNVERIGGQVFLGDLFDALPDRLRGRVDLLMVNAPYVPTGSIELMPPEARLHEPSVALDGGPDGLDIHRRVIAAAGDWLAPGGHLLIETSQEQAPTAAALMARAALTAQIATSDELYATIVIGTRPAG
ncbi:release factor glutamine methyltransferase [Nakamurella panacisegetis]|uniref:peptide chain release factor N(5)-glutamine methyltransferase n=1 Tax=Nakamurella panacisegetis TaxID=1090615 RepID=A0A1H0N4M7_9ACTN|nr:putative protein N(5)-glutamine methyltransferase [Nakamurella panacisegetis]SDO87582.1 release factor glutamine methyltransferase [Nakamurella panacisegetis]